MLRLSEHYTSVQGEGLNVGKLTQFVRFAGCNMRCPLWPCDTEYAIEPSIWRFDSSKIEVDQLAVNIIKESESQGAKNICITGGEPFQQPSQDLEVLVRLLWQNKLHVEVFTNGSYIFPEWGRELQYTMDWKLPGSGEHNTRIEERAMNAMVLKPWDGIKFVVANRDDFFHALGVAQQLRDKKCQAQFWVGSAWGHITDEEIVELMKEHRVDWRLNVQVHKYIYEPTARGV